MTCGKCIAENWFNIFNDKSYCISPLYFMLFVIVIGLTFAFNSYHLGGGGGGVSSKFIAGF